MKLTRFAAPLCLLAAGSAHAQIATGVTIYGVIDEYLGYTDAKGTGKVTTLDSGGLQASRFGFRGSEELGHGIKANFTLEHGFSADTGAAADALRTSFNRQAWVGLSSSELGEIRLGRQNTPQFFMCGNYDAFLCATYGSLLNNVSTYTPRFDNTVHYISPEIAGVKLQAGLALGERVGSGQDGLNAYMAAAEYRSGPLYLGVNHVSQNSANAQFTARATFAGGNYDYGHGKVYVGYFQGTTPGSAVATNVPGRDYKVWSLSADYLVTSAITVGALYGQANDTTASNRDASQFAVIGRYGLSKRSLIYAVATKLTNDNGANFSLGSSGPITRNVPAPGGDVSGVQVGIRHLF